MTLGVMEDEVWRQTTVRLGHGDVLVLYTDGLTGAINEQASCFDEDRLLESVRASLGRPAREIQDAVLADVHRFVGNTPQSDDIALAILIRDSPAGR